MARMAGPANIHGLTRSSQRPFSDSASLFNTQYNNIAPPIPPMMASSAMLLYWVLNKLAESLKGRWEDRVKPWMFAGPAILAIGAYLIYPAIVTLQYSFANEDST